MGCGTVAKVRRNVNNGNNGNRPKKRLGEECRETATRICWKCNNVRASILCYPSSEGASEGGTRPVSSQRREARTPPCAPDPYSANRLILSVQQGSTIRARVSPSRPLRATHFLRAPCLPHIHPTTGSTDSRWDHRFFLMRVASQKSV